MGEGKMPLIVRHYTPSFSVSDLTCSVVSQAWNVTEVLEMSCPAISFCALFSPIATWNARSCTIRNHTLSRNTAFPTRAGRAMPSSSIYHRMTRASLRSWEVSVFWSSPCVSSSKSVFGAILNNLSNSKILWASKLESRHTSHEMQLWG